MDISDKFEKGKNIYSYQRIAPCFKVNIFLGYNNDGNMSVVIREKGSRQSIKSSRLIEVCLKRHDDGKLALSFDLLDSSYSSLFFVFCNDLILVCEKAGKDKAISQAIDRWKYWVKMFEKKHFQLLDNNQIKGLLGELAILDKVLIPMYGFKDSIDGWLGPLMGHKDFEIRETWYEVKTVNDSAIQLTINSLEQLDADVDGHLAVVRICETSEAYEFSCNLNTVVSRIASRITEHDVLENFLKKLENIGYQFTKEYEKFNYSIKDVELYSVNYAFPKLTRKNVNKVIGEAKYTILIPEISEFKE